MKVALFMMDHWDDIMVILALVASVITGLNRWVKKFGPLFESMTNAERIAYVTRLLTNLIPIALVLVTDAEINFGPGTGKLKRSYVIDELYKRVPDEYKRFITEDNLDLIINRALEEAEKLWATNTSVTTLVYGANQRYIKGGAKNV